MKKNLFLAILCVLGLFGTLRAQDNVVTIDGTVGGYAQGTDNHVPIYNNYEYAVTQFYYTVDEIAKAGGTIESIAFKTSNDANYPYTRTFDIYMVNTENYNFGVGGKTMEQVSADDKVFTGSVEFTQDAWITIDINDFEYTGGNVLVCINDYTGTYISGGGSNFLCYESTFDLPYQGDFGIARRATYIRNSNNAYDPTAQAYVAYASQKFVPFIKLTFAAGSTEEFIEPAAPANVAATALNESQIQLTWDALAENVQSYNVYQGTELVRSGLTETTCIFKNLSVGEYCYTVEAVNGPHKTAAEPVCITLSAKSVESITVGTFGEVDATAVPFGTQVNDSWAEHLYTAQEIGKACTIERISFAHKSGNPITTKEIKIYLAETTKTDYADKSWTAEEDLVLVYSDTDIIIGEQEWETFELDTPFEYSGEKNLAVVVAKSSDETSGLLFWYCDEIANSVLVTSETSEYPTATTQSASYNKRPAIRFSWVTGDAPEPTKPAAPVVSAEAISDVAVRLSWASVDDATSYNVYQGTEAVVTALTETTYTVEGLQAETEYSFDVTAVNAVGESERATVTVKTLKANDEPVDPEIGYGYLATTFFYDFENGTIDGWNVIDADGDGKKFEYKDGVDGGLNDGKGLFSETPYNGSPDNYIVTASKYSITSTSEFSFKHVQYDYVYFHENIGVVVSEDGEKYDVIWNYKYEEYSTWQDAVVDLSAYAGKDLYLGLRHYDCNGENAAGIRIDDIRLYSEEPSVPANVTATATTSTVTLTWDKVDNAVSYNVYSVVDDEYTLLKDKITETKYEVKGLKEFTEYCYAVTSSNELKESRYSLTECVTTEVEEGVEILLFEDFEDYEVNNKIAENGADYWTTWSNKPGTSEDGVVAELDGNKCGYFTEGVDQVLRLGGYQAGVFDLEFDIYIPEGNGAYYNILHAFNGGSSVWALQAYLQMTDDGNGNTKISDGHGSIHAGGSNAADIPCVWNGWMHFRVNINANIDEAEYFYTLPNGEEKFAFKWKWSKDSFDEAPGGRKLDAMNFFIQDNTKEYYIDNLSLKRIGGASAAIVAFKEESVDVSMGDEDIRTVDFTIENIGSSMAEYLAWVDYGKGEISDKAQTVTYAAEDITKSVSIGWTSDTPVTFEIAAFYPASSYAGAVMGTYISNAAYFLGEFKDENGNTVPTLEAGTDLIFRIYGQGVDGNPGEILAEKAIASEDIILDWNIVDFDTPVALTGFDFYVAVEMTQCVNGAPMILDGNKESTLSGVADLCRQSKGAFKALPEYTNGECFGNWNLAVNCVGNSVLGGWAELDKKDGQLEPGAKETISLDVVTVGLKKGETYDANIVLKTNTEEGVLELPISLYVWGENIDEMLSNTYSVYPNPTAAQVTVEGENINYIAVYNSVGQLVKVVKTQDNVVDMSACENGVYFFNIVDNAGQSSVQRVVVAK